MLGTRVKVMPGMVVAQKKEVITLLWRGRWQEVWHYGEREQEMLKTDVCA